jgi:hypothetical protein
VIIWELLDNPIRKLLDKKINKGRLDELELFLNNFQDSIYDEIINDFEKYQTKIHNLKDWSIRDVEISKNIEKTKISLKHAYWVKDKIRYRQVLTDLENEQTELRKTNFQTSIYSINDFWNFKYKTKKHIFASKSEQREYERSRLEIINPYKIFYPNNVLREE